MKSKDYSVYIVISAIAQKTGLQYLSIRNFIMCNVYILNFSVFLKNTILYNFTQK